MRSSRTVVALAGAVLVLLLGLAPPAGAAPTQDTPGDTPATASQADCPTAATPGPAVDSSEVPTPGSSSPAPLPVPNPPVGGEAMGTCGTVAPAGVPLPPTVDVDSWVLADLDSGQVLAAKVPHARLRPASTLKTLTGLLVARNLPMTDVVTGTQEDADQEGSRVGIGPGGQYTVQQLLDGLILESGNDIAHALAVRLTGSVPTTVDLMNRTARELGALDTRAVTPSGLDGPGQSTSAYDLASLFRVAMREPPFAQAVGTRQIPFPGYGPVPGFVVSNENKIFQRFPGEAIGGKTGYTNDARHTYIGSVDRNGRRLVAVLVHGEQRPVTMVDKAGTLLDWGFTLPRDLSVGQLTDASNAPATTPDGAATLDPAASGAATTSRWTTPLLITGIVVLALLVAAVRLRSRR